MTLLQEELSVFAVTTRSDTIHLSALTFNGRETTEQRKKRSELLIYPFYPPFPSLPHLTDPSIHLSAAAMASSDSVTL